VQLLFLKGNVKFEKRFGPFDLSSASTSFVISMKDVECSDEVSEAQAEDIRSQIASSMGLASPDRILLRNINCQNNNMITADVELVPIEEPTVRRLFKGFGANKDEPTDSFSMFTKLRKSLEDVPSMNEENRRQLSISNKVSLHRVKIIPSVNDRKLFVTDASMKEEEDKLYRYASSTETFEVEDEDNSFSSIAVVDQDMTKVLDEMSTLKRELEREKEDEISALKRELEKEREEKEAKIAKEKKEKEEREARE